MKTTTDVTAQLLRDLVIAVHDGHLRAETGEGIILLRAIRAHVKLADRSAARSNPVQLTQPVPATPVLDSTEARTVLRGRPVAGSAHYDEVDMTPTVESNTLVAKTEKL